MYMYITSSYTCTLYIYVEVLVSAKKIYIGLSIKHIHIHTCNIYQLLQVHVHVYLLKYHTLSSWHIHKMSWGYTCEPAEENRTGPPFHWPSLFLLHPPTFWHQLAFYPRLCLSPIKIQRITFYLTSIKINDFHITDIIFLNMFFHA